MIIKFSIKPIYEVESFTTKVYYYYVNVNVKNIKNTNTYKII